MSQHRLHIVLGCRLRNGRRLQFDNLPRAVIPQLRPGSTTTTSIPHSSFEFRSSISLDRHHRHSVALRAGAPVVLCRHLRTDHSRQRVRDCDERHHAVHWCSSSVTGSVQGLACQCCASDDAVARRDPTRSVNVPIYPYMMLSMPFQVACSIVSAR